MPLLTYSQQQTIKKISANNQQKYDPLATDVEEKDLKKLLGVALLQDLQKSPNAANNVLLLDGDSFVDCNGNTVDQKGVRWMTAYLNFSAYLGNSFVNDTFTGFVQKTRQDAEILSEGAIKRLQLENRQIALTEWELIEAYLNENKDNFPLWVCTDSKKPFTPKFIGIRKTIK